MSVMGDIKDTKELVGKTIASIETFRAPFASTSNFFSAIVFTDGSCGLLCGDLRPVQKTVWKAADFDLQELQKCPKYFTPADLAEIVESQEVRKRKRAKDARERDQRELERLQRRLEETA